MLEGPPFAQELSALVGKFHEISFPEVFRDTKIPPRRVSFSATPKSISPKPTWATAVSSKSVLLETPPAKEVAAKPDEGIPRNSRGQRVDRPLRVPLSLITDVKQRKLCNHHHLAGYCPYSDCKHEHAKKLSGRELDALRCVARLAPCRLGLDCDDEDCFAGHRCTFDHYRGAECKFPAEMHDVDTKIVEN